MFSTCFCKYFSSAVDWLPDAGLWDDKPIDEEGQLSLLCYEHRIVHIIKYSIAYLVFSRNLGIPTLRIHISIQTVQSQ